MFGRTCLFVSATLLFVAALPANALALGEEAVGNGPLSEANYVAWPGLAEVINDEPRAYFNWVNGNENFYFVGSIDELNVALKKFAAAELKDHEVVLRPGPQTVKTFDGGKTFTPNWHLQIFGGIAAHLLTRDQGDQVWNKHPRLTIYVTDELDLSRLQIPEKVTLLDVSQLSERARKGRKSADKSVRGWSAGILAELDPFDPENLNTIEALLCDDDAWVRLNAAGAAPRFGTKAKSLLPELTACLESDNESLKTAAAHAIEKINAASDDPAVERKHAEL